MKRIRCGECGSAHVESENIQGREIPWGWNTSAVVTKDVRVLVCQECHNMIPSGKDLETLSTCVEIRRSAVG